MKISQSFLARVLTVVVLAGALAGCESGYHGVTSGSSTPPSGHALSGQDACVQSCNNANIRCMEISSTRRTANEDVTTVYGARSDCERDLRQCLPKCRSR